MSDHQEIGAMANLPYELIVDILSRLPSKSLCRFRCVSKTWFSLTYHPHFAKLHLNQNHRHKEKPMLISDSLYKLEYEESLLSSENGAVAVELIFPDLRRVDGWPEILGSCNGLLLVGNEYDDRRFLLNPSIGECRELPKSPFDGKYTVNSDDCFCMYGLGYDSCIDDYKIIRIFCNFTDENFFEVIFSVYNLRTDSWRRIEDYPYDHWYGEQPPAALLNGALHWSALSRGSDHSGTIVSFDLVNEKFQDLAPPSFVQDPGLHGLGVLGGCLAMLVSTDSGYDVIDVCVMKKYGVKESWTKFSMARPDKYLDPVCFPRNGEVVWKEDNKLILYNPNEETYREVEISGVSKFVAGMTYVESLVSPNYYNGIDTDRASETMSDIDSNQCWKNWENDLRFKRECHELFKYNEKLLEALQSCTAPNDVFAQTTGEDGHGCACTSGLGVSPSNICGSRAVLSEAIRMSEIEKAQKIAYEQRKSAVLEELLAMRRKLIKMMRGFSFSIKEESHSSSDSSESDSQ